MRAQREAAPRGPLNLVVPVSGAKRKRKFKRDATLLKSKALASLRTGLDAFNSFSDDARQTKILLSLQHAAEMLLKAGLVQRGVGVFDKKSGKSKGFSACLNLAAEHLKASEEERGAFRSLDAQRDGEQHWLIVLSEQVMFLQVRAFITAFDDVLHRVFGERLADLMPARVLPVSTSPLTSDIVSLFDREFKCIEDLLKPGKRKRDEALGRIRQLLAVEGHVADVDLSEKDVSRVEAGIRKGRTLAQVFPRLASLGATVTGTGPEVRVIITKRDGAPVHLVRGDDETNAFAYREVDLQSRFKYSAYELADHAGVARHKAASLRKHIELDSDAELFHEFVFHSQKIRRYSDKAIETLRAAAAKLDVDAIYRASLKPRGGKRG